MMLSIAAEEEEFEERQMEKLKIRGSTFEKMDWAAQHEPLARLSKHTHQFVTRFIYH